MVNIKGVGWYPPRSKEFMSGTRMRVKLAGRDMQWVFMDMDQLVENFANDKRPSPSSASVTTKVKDNEYFDRTDSIVAFRDNIDYYKVWNHRRLWEGLEKVLKNLTVLWYFMKDSINLEKMLHFKVICR